MFKQVFSQWVTVCWETHIKSMGRYDIRRAEEWRWGKEVIVCHKMLLTSIFKWIGGDLPQQLISTSTETCQKSSSVFVTTTHQLTPYECINWVGSRIDLILFCLMCQHRHASVSARLRLTRSNWVKPGPFLWSSFPSHSPLFVYHLQGTFLLFLSHWQNPKLTDVKRSVAISIRRLRVSLLLF